MENWITASKDKLVSGSGIVIAVILMYGRPPTLGFNFLYLTAKCSRIRELLGIWVAKLDELTSMKLSLHFFD
ncbi:hypothetical protein SDJN02_11825, partial [Cucurbita argyrosperma subsp. argyrosperma]